MVSVIWGWEYIEAWDIIVGSKRTVGSSEVSRANRFDCYKVLIVSDKQVACVAGTFSGYPGYPHAKFQIIEELSRVKGGGVGRSRHPSLAFIFSPKVYPKGYSPFFHYDKIKDEDHGNATIINKELSPSPNNACALQAISRNLTSWKGIQWIIRLLITQ